MEGMRQSMRQERVNRERRCSLFAASLVAFATVGPMEAKAEYTLGGDSLPQDGVPKGTVTKYVRDGSAIYPGTTHEYWVYVPAQYTGAKPAAVMVFQDGGGYVAADGPVRAPTVFDNLIHKREMPVTIGIFVNPGRREHEYQRSAQYVPLDDTYARFLLEEVLPWVGEDYSLVDDAAGRAICGMSDGGLASFTVAWQRPDAFSKAISHIGSYTRLHGGSTYPYLIRQTRGDPKPIRVFLQDGANDINLTEGNWTLANLAMESALMFARYDYRFKMGTGGHDLDHGGAIFPDTLRWIWRDYPGVEYNAPGLEAVTGRWDVVTNVNGLVRDSVLTVAADAGALTASIDDAVDGEIEVTNIGFEYDVLTYEYNPPASQAAWGKGHTGPMTAWLKVDADTFRGALSGESTIAMDYSVRGERRAPEARD